MCDGNGEGIQAHADRVRPIIQPYRSDIPGVRGLLALVTFRGYGLARLLDNPWRCPGAFSRAHYLLHAHGHSGRYRRYGPLRPGAGARKVQIFAQRHRVCKECQERLVSRLWRQVHSRWMALQCLRAKGRGDRAQERARVPDRNRRAGEAGEGDKEGYEERIKKHISAFIVLLHNMSQLSFIIEENKTLKDLLTTIFEIMERQKFILDVDQSFQALYSLKTIDGGKKELTDDYFKPGYEGSYSFLKNPVGALEKYGSYYIQISIYPEIRIKRNSKITILRELCIGMVEAVEHRVFNGDTIEEQKYSVDVMNLYYSLACDFYDTLHPIFGYLSLLGGEEVDTNPQELINKKILHIYDINFYSPPLVRKIGKDKLIKTQEILNKYCEKGISANGFIPREIEQGYHPYFKEFNDGGILLSITYHPCCSWIIGPEGYSKILQFLKLKSKLG